jgi:hypothetical protein
MHDALAAALGIPYTGETIPFSMVNKSYVYGLQDIVLGDLVQKGMDFWWTDWQQGYARVSLPRHASCTCISVLIPIACFVHACTCLRALAMLRACVFVSPCPMSIPPHMYASMARRMHAYTR